MLEGSSFTIFSDHKPIIFAYQQKSNKASPRQLDFISQFSTDIQFITGKNNITADFLSRIETIDFSSSIDYQKLQTHQETNSELQHLKSETNLKLKKLQIGNIYIYCDTSTTTVRPYIPSAFRKAVFKSVHELAHPGQKLSTKLVCQRYIWPSMRKDCAKWAKECIACQRAKIQRHTTSPVLQFDLTGERFRYVHVDLTGPLPPVKGNVYCLTCIDRFTSWSEVFPIADSTTETIAHTFYNGWLARFGVPEKIVTDQGRQFESSLFTAFTNLLGIRYIRTTAYHPQANGKIERYHRTLKQAIKAHEKKDWISVLPHVLLDLRCALKSDQNISPAELMYNTVLRLPGEIFTENIVQTDTCIFVTALREKLKHIKPIQPVLTTLQEKYLYHQT